MKIAEKKSSKKEYEAPQMDVIAFDVQGAILLDCSGGIVEECTDCADQNSSFNEALLMVKICMKTKKKYEKPQMEIYNVRRTKAALLLYSGGAAYLGNESNPVV